MRNKPTPATRERTNARRRLLYRTDPSRKTHEDEYRATHKDATKVALDHQRTARILAWKNYLLNKHGEFKCEACGCALTFLDVGTGKLPTTISWDHKTGEEPIKGYPSAWLAGHTLNAKNIETWEACDFGMLCNICNFLIGKPKDRERRVLRLLEYAQQSAGE